jgi:hypothetical protein
MKINVLVVLAGLVTTALFAQEYRGTFSGSVTDPQGAAIPGAKVVVTETRTGTKATVASDAAGAYSFQFLAPGEYEITAEAAGFKRFVRQGLTLSAGQRPVIDIRLEVGAMSESVTVTAESPLIVAATSAMGQVVTTGEVEDVPLNGRAPIMLSALALGVISTSEGVLNHPFDSVGGSFSMGGTSSNEILLDGVPNARDAASGALSYSPPQDAVMEVRVSLFESDAAYGHAGGGTMNLVTKSGTNSLHWAAYEFNQVAYLEANSFFQNKVGQRRSNFNYNQYGLVAGGPVWIPRLFNGKNRLFWTFAYEGLRDGVPVEPAEGFHLATVPTPAERQGDFSALLKVNSSYTIYDPATGVPSGSQVARTPFPNNTVPNNRLNPIALKYLQYFPQPNATGGADGFQNYFISLVDPDGYDNELGRLDINVSDKNKLAFNFRNSSYTQTKRDYFHNLATGNFLWRHNVGTTLDEIYTISPTLIMDIRANWTRFSSSHGSNTDGFDPATLGFPSYLAASSQSLTMPGIAFGSCSATTGGSYPSFQCLGPETGQSNDFIPTNIYQLFGDVVKSWGNHTTKAGADIRDAQFSAFSAGHSAGNFVFNANWTNGPLNNAAAAPVGQDLAAFLLGLPSSGTFDINGYSTAVSKYYAFFVQDDWRAKSSLIVNLGLRWEHETPSIERFNRVVNGFDPAAVNPISAAAAAAYASSPISQIPASQFKALGGLTFATADHRSVYSSNSRIFSPRFGIAWTPKALGGKTVLRGGFGVFVTPRGVAGVEQPGGTTAVSQPGFSQTTQFVATNNNYLSPASTLSNPFPGGIGLPSGSSKGAGTFLGQQITFYNTQVRAPYSMRLSASIQRQLPGQMVLEVAYIGNHAVHLFANRQLDYVPRQYMSTSRGRDTATINLLTGTVTNPLKGLLPNSTALNGSTVALQQLLAPFPQYPVGSGTSNGVIMQGDGFGSSYYHSLNVRLQKRLTHGLTLISNFVWSKLVEETAYLNDSDPAPEKRIASSSRPVHEILGGSYELPIGRGKPLNVGSRVVDALVGGWALNGVLSLQTGPPLSWGNLIYYGGPLNLDSHQPDGVAFDVTQFNRVSSQQLANNIRTFDTLYNNLRRDPTKNLDLSLLKKFSLGERMYLQVRFETFNTTNHVTFDVPNLTPTSTAFGTISAQANTPRKIQTGARLVW